MPAFAIDLSVLKIGPADRRHQDRRHAHLACLVDELTQVRFIRRVRLRTAHIGQGVLSFRTQACVLDIHIFAFAFLVIMRKLNDEVVPCAHLLLDARPQVLRLIERTRARAALTAVIHLHTVGIKEHLQVHAPTAFGRCGRLVTRHRAVANRVNFALGCLHRNEHQHQRK